MRLTAPVAERSVVTCDQFRLFINDTFGHPVGDHVLQEVARRMSGRELLRASDSVGRLGGDEFAVVLSGLSSPDEATTVAEKIVDAVSTPINVDGHEFQIGCSIGIAVAPVHGTEPTQLLQRADVAMYVAKAGEASVAVYTPAADVARIARLALIGELRQAIVGEQLVLHYQPIIDLRTGELARVEALVRWNHPTRGLVMPDDFIPTAEQAGIIMPLTTWALRDALRQSRLWHSEGINIPVAVNISAQTLHDPRLVATVEEWYAGPTTPGPLELEITESAVLSDPDAAVVVLARLVAKGVRIAIDDFGTGYSSLAQLKRLPVHSVKVDKSFVAEMHTDRRDASIVQTVIHLSHTLGLDVVAEGVETEKAADHLTRLGCDYGQGWHFGVALPAVDMTAVLLNSAQSRDRDELESF
ncbi:MAG: bifunctional diguanylate cyclase/phosphodiesterase [Mycobacteriales bacterium]